MSWILTSTGRQFYPLQPRAEDVCLEDIAHALSLKCRFTGHCREFYSVAQHSVLVSEYLAAQGATPELQLAGLLHDAAEAYLPDVATPIKEALYVVDPLLHPEAFGVTEYRLLHAICELLGVQSGLCYLPQIKLADRVLLMTEKRDLMATPPEPWDHAVPHLWNTIIPQPPREAKQSFLQRYGRLQKAIKESEVAA
jgi:uncharacterized protein